MVKTINPICAAHVVAEILGCVYDPDSMKLWIKIPDRGLWVELPDERLAFIINTLLLFYFRWKQLQFGFKATTSTAGEIIKAIKGCCVKEGFFSGDQKYYIHCKNCFVRYNASLQTWEPFELTDEQFRSRNQINAEYDPKAKSPRFTQLLEGATTADGIRVVQGYSGQILLGRNLSQTLLLVTGDAGSGKSTVVNVIQKVLGESNSTELRTNAMHGYYEIGRYEGHSLLVGLDVPSSFLRERGAEKIKALTGGDRLTVEKKHSNWVGSFRGHLNVVIVSNSNQPVRIDGDREAWERRVRSVHFHQPKVKPEPIRDFDSILASEEGSGILNFALEGLARIIDAGGQLEPSKEQKDQIADLLNESESTRVWLENCVESAPRDMCLRPCSASNSVTTMEAYTSYCGYCDRHHWTPLAMSVFSKQLPDRMAATFKVEPSTNVKRDDGNKRGYKGVRLKDAQENEAEDNRA